MFSICDQYVALCENFAWSRHRNERNNSLFSLSQSGFSIVAVVASHSFTPLYECIFDCGFNRHCSAEPSIMPCISYYCLCPSSCICVTTDCLYCVSIPPLCFHVSLPALLLCLAQAGSSSFHLLLQGSEELASRKLPRETCFIAERQLFRCPLQCTAGLLGFNISLVIYF